MGLIDLFRRKRGASTDTSETSTSGSGYTAEITAARESYIAGRTGLGDLTATV